ncbi:hypothetical protein [Hyphomonas chukchiensis]|uniref:DUF4760 domain-containing protein n=1 Tax=Hyphomonas chukchiensis TaxID=1280947 RepID=A0A062UQG7_9PROT|nr:hypothetical protein [Hyphomonas chukchiensis]KCZ60022.1 hypothetical protein HY30_13405 [Hyphomonas chukchiensis]|tara:strand:- start:667 stop:1161 length:495 start_codon:yes stop_codon:yes gene_type:complete
MTLDTVATIANIMASGAVVLTLVFIGLQLRQNAHLTRMAAAQTSAQLLSANMGRVTESADLAEVLSREDGLSSWTRAEALRVSNFLSISFRHFEVLHTHRRFGVFEDELWEGSEARLRESLSDPDIREWWAGSRMFYARSFVKYVDRLAAELEVAQAMSTMGRD